MRRAWEAEAAILLASAPRDVREYLARRASRPSCCDPISKETEAALLSRNDRLIDLSLAEYCFHRETAKALFERDPDDWPMRALLLSNRCLGPASLGRGFPECLFGSEDALHAFLGQITANERALLFGNPGLDEPFLRAFLSLERPWEAMDPAQRLWALGDLATNEMLYRERSLAERDDQDDNVTDTPIEAAWSLIEKLEPKLETAKYLGALLRDLPVGANETQAIADALGRWRAGANEAAFEAAENARGRLDYFQVVRQAGARLLARRHDAKPGLYLDSDDIAFRCGAYEATRDLDVRATRSAVERDGELARVHLIRNERLWRCEKTRGLLVDVVLQGAETEGPNREFNRRKRHYRQQFPAWFEGEAYSEPDERLIVEGSIADVVAGVSADPAVRGLQKRLAAIEKAQLILIWLVAIAVIGLAAHALYDRF